MVSMAWGLGLMAQVAAVLAYAATPFFWGGGRCRLSRE
jgi:hypothetical protein